MFKLTIMLRYERATGRYTPNGLCIAWRCRWGWCIRWWLWIFIHYSQSKNLTLFTYNWPSFNWRRQISKYRFSWPNHQFIRLILHKTPKIAQTSQQLSHQTWTNFALWFKIFFIDVWKLSSGGSLRSQRCLRIDWGLGPNVRGN